MSDPDVRGPTGFVLIEEEFTAQKGRILGS